MTLMNDFVGKFVDLCKASGLDPKDALEILNAGESIPEEYVTIPPFTIPDASI